MRSLALLIVGLLGAVACSVSTSSGREEASPSGEAPDCASRCAAVADACNTPGRDCTQHCASLSESQLDCIEAARCDTRLMDRCVSSGTTPDAGKSDGSAQQKDGGAGRCIAMGGSGCSSLNAPSGCCADAVRTKVVCNGNNDGKGTAQCCVNMGNPCVSVNDCCGYAATSGALRTRYSCTKNVCTFN